jgi:hypothetical protein
MCEIPRPVKLFQRPLPPPRHHTEAVYSSAPPPQQNMTITRNESERFHTDFNSSRSAAISSSLADVLKDKHLSVDKHDEELSAIGSEASDIDEVISLSDGGSDEDYEKLEEDEIEEVSGCEDSGVADFIFGSSSSVSRFSDRSSFANSSIRSTFHSEPCLTHVVSVRELQMNPGACAIDFNAFLMNQKGPARDLKYEKRKESRLGKTSKSKKKSSGTKVFKKKRRTS